MFVCLFLAGVGVHEACESLVSQPEMEPVPPPVEMRSLNHWTAREFLDKGVECKQARGDRGPAVMKEILGLEERTEASTQHFY